MDMEMAVQNHLERLVDLTWFRMMEEFGKIIFEGIIEKEKNTREWIEKIYSILDKNRRERNGYPFYDRLIDEYRKKVETINVLEAGADAVKKTITFRVGEILLYIPRWIKLVFFR